MSKISEKLLAQYAEGKVTDVKERNAVRKYLVNNPSELESVMMMMDRDFDIQLDKNSFSKMIPVQKIFSARNFAPNILSVIMQMAERKSFRSRLDELMKDIY